MKIEHLEEWVLDYKYSLKKMLKRLLFSKKIIKKDIALLNNTGGSVKKILKEDPVINFSILPILSLLICFCLQKKRQSHRLYSKFYFFVTLQNM